MAIKPLLSALTLCLALCPAALPSFAQPADGKECFSVTQFENWRAGDNRTLYIRVRGNQFYRLDLRNECFPLDNPGARLISTFRGSNMICSPLDWDLRVSPGLHDTVVPCVVKSMRLLTPAEVAALPGKSKP